MRLFRRLAYWLRLRSNGTDLMDELSFHREMVERDLVRSGLTPAAAKAQARRTMGNETVMREASRAVWLWPALEAVWQDATYTVRDLRRNRTFTLGVTLTLALGIGANAAMFTLVDRLLLRPPALMIDPGTVHQVYLYRTSDGVERETGGQYVRNVDIAKYSAAFSQTAMYALLPLAVGTGEATRVRNVAVVSASFFAFFDAPPVIGRYYTATEDAPPTPAPVAVLSRGLWVTQFGARRDIIGSALAIDAANYTIIGVAPDELVGLWPYQAPAVFIPVATYAASEGPPNWATTYGHAFGVSSIVRRKPNVTVTAATADLTNALRRSYEAQYAQESRALNLKELRPRAVAGSILSERGPERSSVARVAVWLSGVTVIVLLIACANVANLMLARTIRRRREIAVRVALGVSRLRLFAQLLTEGIVLALIGGAGGLALAFWGSRLLRVTFLPNSDHVPLLTDSRTLLFAGAVTLGVGVLTGLAPLAHLHRGTVTADLKSGAREGTYHRTALRTALLLTQSALSVVLLVAAGLFVRSLNHVRDVPLGFDADSVMFVEMQMRDIKVDSAAMAALRLRLLQATKDVPGVSQAALQEAVPFARMSSWPIFVSGIDSVDALGEFDVNTVSPDYFATMGTRIVRGRGFENSDRANTQRVAVVGESMAAVLWPGKDPIGQCFRFGADTVPCTYVVGVAEDIHSQSINAEPKLFYYYLPAAQWRPQDGGLFVRARGDVRQLMEPVRKRLQAEMPGSSFVTVTPLDEIVDLHRRSWILGARVFTVFGVLAVVLAALGLYSVIAYNVAQRRHELGVRLALGAARAEIVRLVVTESVRFALFGLALGCVVSLAGSRWIAPLMFKESPRDPAVFAIVTLVLLFVAIAASWIPALRAAGVDPKMALQSD
jgi:putative ABC transport system permease protein